MNSRARAYQGRVIFDHLPKTAGMAVNAWLKETLGEGCVTDNLIGTHKTLIAHYGGQYSVITGHVDFKGEGLDPRYDYITCFRHPVDRAISWIYYVLENFGEHELVGLRKGVRSFLDSEGEMGIEYIRLNFSMIDHLLSINRDQIPDPDQKLQRAMQLVDQYAVWGIYERLNDFIYDFASYLRVPAPQQLSPFNTTHRRPKVEAISSRLRARIEQLYVLDLVLYERLQAKYDQSRQRWLSKPPQNPIWIKLDPEKDRPWDARGKVLLTDYPSVLHVGQQIEQLCKLCNLTSNAWLSTGTRPLNLSYHWLNLDRSNCIYEGLRTPLPEGYLAAGLETTISMKIKAPEVMGEYILSVLPVQEEYAWFDELGFTPGEIRIQVLDSD